MPLCLFNFAKVAFFDVNLTLKSLTMNVQWLSIQLALQPFL